jgi:hypothetical protein
VFTVSSIGQVGAQLYPGSIATSTPQTFNVASPPTSVLGFGVDPNLGVTHCPPAHIRQIGAGTFLTGLPPLVRLRYAF